MTTRLMTRAIPYGLRSLTTSTPMMTARLLLIAADCFPHQVFDDVDSDDDGSITLEEFITAVGMLKKSVLEVTSPRDLP